MGRNYNSVTHSVKVQIKGVTSVLKLDRVAELAAEKSLSSEAPWRTEGVRSKNRT